MSFDFLLKKKDKDISIEMCIDNKENCLKFSDYRKDNKKFKLF